MIGNFAKMILRKVHHRLLRTVLVVHHIPNEIICLTENLYTDFSISVVTKEIATKLIPWNAVYYKEIVYHHKLFCNPVNKDEK